MGVTGENSYKVVGDSIYLDPRESLWWPGSRPDLDAAGWDSYGREMQLDNPILDQPSLTVVWFLEKNNIVQLQAEGEPPLVTDDQLVEIAEVVRSRLH